MSENRMSNETGQNNNFARKTGNSWLLCSNDAVWHKKCETKQAGFWQQQTVSREKTSIWLRCFPMGIHEADIFCRIVKHKVFVFRTRVI